MQETVDAVKFSVRMRIAFLGKKGNNQKSRVYNFNTKGQTVYILV